jgi:hypothetical protein
MLMPSPFPGMDPYLENPHTWPNLHLNLISSIQAALNRTIQPKYVAIVEERVYVSNEDDPGRTIIVPDVRVLETESKSPRKGDDGGAALVVAEPIIAVTLLDEEIHESRLSITDAETKKVVTVIEVLSPSNKHPGASGRTSYMEKRQEVLSSRTHFVEVDLLRTGKRTYSHPRPRVHHYGVHVSEHEMRPRGKLWLMTLANRLPVVEIPLKKKDGHAKLDLQLAFAEAYERGGYGAIVDYRKPPVPPLTGEWIAWAKSVLARSKS